MLPLLLPLRLLLLLLRRRRAVIQPAKKAGTAIKKMDGGLRMAPLTRRDETMFASLARKALFLGQRSALLCPTCCRACAPVGHASEGQGR
jgi:hypothetical protein